MARYQLGDVQEVIKDLNEAIRINPTSYACRYANRANVYANLGKRQEAMANYQKAKALYLVQGITGIYLKTSLAMQ